MKKFFFSILAVGALIACTKSEVAYDEPSEISLAPVTSTVTKAVTAAINSTDYPEKEQFIVWAYWQNLNDKTSWENFDNASTYINGKAFGKKGDYWGGVSKKYTWPKTGSLIFACLSPLEGPFSNVAHSLKENKFTFDYNNPVNTANTVDLLWADNTPKSSDKYTTAVPVTFEHALSWITFTVTGQDAAIDNYVVNNITINNVNTEAKFDSSRNNEWYSWNNKQPIVVFDGEEAVKAEKKEIENVKRGTLVIPQSATSPYKATLVYTNNTGDTPIQETLTLELNNEWEIGKHYFYNITFTTTEILINPTVEPWETETPELEYWF